MGLESPLVGEGAGIDVGLEYHSEGTTRSALAHLHRSMEFSRPRDVRAEILRQVSFGIRVICSGDIWESLDLPAEDLSTKTMCAVLLLTL